MKMMPNKQSQNFRVMYAMRTFSLLSALCIALSACSQKEEQSTTTTTAKKNVNLDSLQTAYFASGCFWCVEAIFESLNGVEEVVSGYSGGKEKNPTYEQVSAGLTGHAESVKIYYDSSKVSYQTLLEVFFGSHDPTTLNQQGPDRGKQYRSAIFYKNTGEKAAAEAYIQELLKAKTFSKITTELAPFSMFYEAEDYHQDYERMNPDNSYVRAVSIPRLNKFKQKFPKLLKKKH
jgi:peptide-methionine (S)-S-oxide reductase